MTTKICVCCGHSFEPRPQVPNQSYCSSPVCQRARRQRWQRDKLQTDPDYRENQQRSQRAWFERHPEYWRHYRDINPEYVEHNRARQRIRDQPRQEADLAKMDASASLGLLPGLYLISLVQGMIADLDGGVIVEITPVCAECLCKKDACKDRT